MSEHEHNNNYIHVSTQQQGIIVFSHGPYITGVLTHGRATSTLTSLQHLASGWRQNCGRLQHQHRRTSTSKAAPISTTRTRVTTMWYTKKLCKVKPPDYRNDWWTKLWSLTFHTLVASPPQHPLLVPQHFTRFTPLPPLSVHNWATLLPSLPSCDLSPRPWAALWRQNSTWLSGLAQPRHRPPLPRFLTLNQTHYVAFCRTALSFPTPSVLMDRWVR